MEAGPLRSALEGDSDEQFVETIQESTWEEAAERAMGITDVLLAGLFPADEEEGLSKALEKIS